MLHLTAESIIETSVLREALYDTLSDHVVIRRSSGALLPIEIGYSSLTLVKHQTKQDDKAFNTTPDGAAPNAAIEQERIALNNLFQSQCLKNRTTAMPQRILIQGHAGMGKTTLLKKCLYDFLHHDRWRENFDWILPVDLGQLKGKPQSYQLTTLFYDEYFAGHLDGKLLAEALYQSIQSNPSKTLFLLDGLEQIRQDDSNHCLNQLLNHTAVVITSRSYNAYLNQMHPVDLEVKILGFNKEATLHYLDNNYNVSFEEAVEIKTYIKQYQCIQPLVRTPMQLDIIGSHWYRIRQTDKTSPTLTAVYNMLIQQLWRKDIVRLGKALDGVRLTHATVNGIKQFDRLKELVATEQDYLERLAFYRLCKDPSQLALDNGETAIQTFAVKDDERLPLNLELNLQQVSLLEIDEVDKYGDSFGYRFLDSSIQQFFVAQYLVKHLTQHKQLDQLSRTNDVRHFIRIYQYSSQYALVWQFMAGLLRDDTLITFCEILNEGSNELIGIRHQQLMMDSLKESRRQLPNIMVNELEAGLSDWLDFEIKQAQVYVSVSSLGCKDAFPEYLLLERLDRTEISFKDTCMIANTLGRRSSLSSQAVSRLVQLYQNIHQDRSVCYFVSDALAQQTSLSSQSMQRLMEIAKGVESRSSSFAIRLMAQQSRLSPDAVQCLADLCQHDDIDIKVAAADSLGQHSISFEAMQSLLRLCRHEDIRVRGGAIRSLGSQTTLPHEILDDLMKLSKDQDTDIRSNVTWALAQHTNASHTVIRRLIDLSKDADINVRLSSLIALQAVPLSSDVLDDLIVLSKDSNAHARAMVADIFAEQANLSQKAIQCLLALSKDKDDLVRSSALQSLVSQSSLPSEILPDLIELSKDDAIYVRPNVTQALVKQPHLPFVVMQWLISLSQDLSSELRCSLAESLHQKHHLSPDLLQCLIELSKDTHTQVQCAAAWSLGIQARFSSDALQCLTELLTHPDSEVRASAAWALVQMPNLSLDAMQRLIDLSKDRDADIRAATAATLGAQSSLSPDGTQCLLTLSLEQSSHVMSSALGALKRQHKLPSESIQLLMTLSKQPNTSMQLCAIQALGQQSELTNESLQCLLQLLSHPNHHIRSEALDTLRQQPVWHAYALIAKHTEWINTLYKQWIIPSNLKQVSVCYTNNHHLYFDTPKGMQAISLGARERDFKKRVLEAQQAVGIPKKRQLSIENCFSASYHHTCTWTAPTLVGLSDSPPPPTP